MIELPEAHVLADQVSRTLNGKRIQKATANQSPHKFAWYTGDPANYNNLLSGKTIQTAQAYGGAVEITVDDMALLISTPLRYHSIGEKMPQKHQLLLEFDDFTALTGSIQMWGCIYCFKQGEPEGLKEYIAAKEHPSPLQDAFDLPYLMSLFDDNTRKLSAKAFLATEQRIPGFGNGVLQDILWTARIHPKRKMAELSEDAVAKLFMAVKSVLCEMTALGGRDTEKDLFGNIGGYKTILSKNTVENPCPACGSVIKREAYLGGNIYYCPGCQEN